MNSKNNGVPEILTGSWTYRSFLSNPDLSADFDSLQFGLGTITINEAPMQTLDGLIFGPGWELKLSGTDLLLRNYYFTRA